ncbi:MAG: thiolase family protein [Syntrophomonadaceae bacterium]|jgi:acetyl-CoA C-acetyltransferase|nr:thiolase family protein [Syntrophomonadaceae bacterium]
MRDVVIIDIARSAIGKMGGTLKDVKAIDLISQVAQAVVERNEDKIKPEDYDYLFLGQVKQNTVCANIARNLALDIGLPEEVPASTVTVACGSGLLSMIEGYEFIKNGFAEIVLAGGVESMSTGEFFLSGKLNQAFGTNNITLMDAIIAGGPGGAPVERYGDIPMGITAENLVEIHNISREEQDEFGFRSQQLALKAIADGDFEDEIVPVEYTQDDGSKAIFKVDEFPRKTSLEAMAKLKPVFKKDGTVTAASSSGRNDGAAIAILMSKEKADELGLKPKAYFTAAGIAGVDPSIMGRGPVPATKIAMEKADLTMEDMQLVELNEAFAGQSLAVYREWEEMWGVSKDWFNEHVNMWGGAIALGHPLGASGCIITTKLIYGLERTAGQYGLSTMCCGGGIGVAGIFERIY